MGLFKLIYLWPDNKKNVLDTKWLCEKLHKSQNSNIVPTSTSGGTNVFAFSQPSKLYSYFPNDPRMLKFACIKQSHEVLTYTQNFCIFPTS